MHEHYVEALRETILYYEALLDYLDDKIPNLDSLLEEFDEQFKENN